MGVGMIATRQALVMKAAEYLRSNHAVGNVVLQMRSDA
jgi:hypothetical protein